MNVFFRLDSSHEIGIGHLKRCLLLAIYLRNNGFESYFVCRNYPGNFSKLILDAGFKVFQLPENKIFSSDILYERWLGDTFTVDSCEFINAAQSVGNIDLVIVDHYGIDSQWHKEIRNALNCKILVIDDLADRTYDCDLLLDQTLGRKDLNYLSLTPAACHLLLGSKYALLNEEFSKRRMRMKKRSIKSHPKILISMGGTDLHNVSETILKYFSKWKGIKAVSLTIVGRLSSNSLSIIKNLSSGGVCHFEYTDIMPELIESHDLCIGALGSSSWERCCLGLPSIAILTAENQKHVAYSLEELGAIQYLGEWTNLEQEKFLDSLDLLLTNKDIYEKMSESALYACDGMGLERVYKALIDELN